MNGKPPEVVMEAGFTRGAEKQLPLGIAEAQRTKLKGKVAENAQGQVNSNCCYPLGMFHMGFPSDIKFQCKNHLKFFLASIARAQQRGKALALHLCPFSLKRETSGKFEKETVPGRKLRGDPASNPSAWQG